MLDYQFRASMADFESLAPLKCWFECRDSFMLEKYRAGLRNVGVTTQVLALTLNNAKRGI